MSRRGEKFFRCLALAAFACIASAGSAWAQSERAGDDAEFGPVVQTYLGYLRAEQEVVDDRASRHEVSPAYYRRNSNRIRALRQMALRIARETRNDFLPELYAVTRDELGTLFEQPSQASAFSVGEIVENTFRYLGTVRAGEPFYMFARLDVYEQAELLKRQEAKPSGQEPKPAAANVTPDAAATPSSATRPRRVSNLDPPRRD